MEFVSQDNHQNGLINVSQIIRSFVKICFIFFHLFFTYRTTKLKGKEFIDLVKISFPLPILQLANTSSIKSASKGKE